MRDGVEKHRGELEIDYNIGEKASEMQGKG